MYLNFHTHRSEAAEGTRSVRNIIVGRDKAELDGSGFFSAGIHPWYISEKPEELEVQFQTLEFLINRQEVKLVGECGLDKLRGPALEVQKKVFVRQLQLAQAYNKSVIIHSVKAANEIIQIQKQYAFEVPMIVHGFNNKAEIARQFLHHRFYFSFGAAILSESSSAQHVIKEIPHTRLFLETDDKEIQVAEIYEKASMLLNVPLDQLKDIIFANWMSLKIEDRS